MKLPKGGKKHTLFYFLNVHFLWLPIFIPVFVCLCSFPYTYFQMALKYLSAQQLQMTLNMVWNRVIIITCIMQIPLLFGTFFWLHDAFWLWYTIFHSNPLLIWYVTTPQSQQKALLLFFYEIYKYIYTIITESSQNENAYFVCIWKSNRLYFQETSLCFVSKSHPSRFTLAETLGFRTWHWRLWHHLQKE